VNELRSVAVGGVLVVCVSVLVATTLLPGVLAVLGRRLDAGRIWRPKGTRSPRWTRWGRFVTERPLLVLVLAGVPMCALALEARGLRTELPRGDWLPRDMESAIALRELIAMKRSAAINGIRVLVELPGNALDDAAWASTKRIAATLANDSAVASVRSLPGLLAPMESFAPRRVLFAALPVGVRRAFVSRDSQATMLEVIPREGASTSELVALVGRIRAGDSRGIKVGGLPAFNADYETAVAGRFFRIVALIVAATFVMLAFGFRSLLVPIKAIVLNLLAVAGAFGAVKLVFQDGFGASLLGLPGPLDAIFPAIPILVFCIVFGLSMDYEVFLVSRVREARQSGLDERSAIVEGLDRTGGIITSAAAIMIVVFGAFTFGGFLVIKMLGFALATAVLIDATVMRLAVGPALLALAGRWNWWPGDSRR
jgi:putative drug exporter of the RND superfamily